MHERFLNSESFGMNPFTIQVEMTVVLQEHAAKTVCYL
jgi:hypothetical protein